MGAGVVAVQQAQVVHRCLDDDLSPVVRRRVGQRPGIGAVQIPRHLGRRARRLRGHRQPGRRGRSDHHERTDFRAVSLQRHRSRVRRVRPEAVPNQHRLRRPQLSDLRDSGSIEAEADMVMLLYRDSYYKAKEEKRSEVENYDEVQVAEVIIAKHRNGPVGKVKLGFQPAYARFRNLDQGAAFADPED